MLPKISKNFYHNLKLVLKTNKVSFFQLRLKNYSLKQKILIGKKIKNICKKYNVKYLINDEPLLAKKLDADGCHLGQRDMGIFDARKILKKKIIGVTCHNSIKLAKKAQINGANYIALGAFFKAKTKKVIWNGSSQSYSKNSKWNYFDEIINYDEQFQITISQRYTLKIKYYLDRIKQKFLVSKKPDSLYKAPPNDPIVNTIFQSEYDTYESTKEDENFEL